MTGALYRLVYFSRNKISPKADLLDAAIQQILISSRRNNAANALTGALLFNAGCFAQVLEGPLGPLEETFERILQDERHGDVALLVFEPIAGRSFPDWAMGFLGGSPDTARHFARIGEASGLDRAFPDATATYLLIKRLAIEDEAEWGFAKLSPSVIRT